MAVDRRRGAYVDRRWGAYVDQLKGVYVDRHSRQKGTNMLFSSLTSNLVLMIYSLTNLRLNITGDSEI